MFIKREGYCQQVCNLRSRKRRNYLSEQFANWGQAALVETARVIHGDSSKGTFYKVTTLVPNWSIFLQMRNTNLYKLVQIGLSWLVRFLRSDWLYTATLIGHYQCKWEHSCPIPIGWGRSQPIGWDAITGTPLKAGRSMVQEVKGPVCGIFLKFRVSERHLSAMAAMI